MNVKMMFTSDVGEISLLIIVENQHSVTKKEKTKDIMKSTCGNRYSKSTNLPKYLNVSREMEQQRLNHEIMVSCRRREAGTKEAELDAGLL